MRDLAMNDSPSFSNWTHDMFLYMCILSGCDYCSGIPGIGIKTAHKLVRMYRSPSKIFLALKAAGRMPQGFKDSFWQAHRTFRHQRVYFSEKEEVAPLLPISADKSHSSNIMDIWPFLGPWMCPEMAKGIATGILHPSARVPWSMMLAETNDKIKSTWKPSNKDQLSCTNKDTELLSRPETSSHTPGATCQKDNIFRFFPLNKSKEKVDLREEFGPLSKPPLEEISIYSATRKIDVSNERNICKNQAQPIPIHFSEYSSKLVGTTFETLSRRRKQCGTSVGRNVSEIMQRLKNQTKVKSQEDPKFLEVEHPNLLNDAVQSSSDSAIDWVDPVNQKAPDGDFQYHAKLRSSKSKVDSHIMDRFGASDQNDCDAGVNNGTLNDFHLYSLHNEQIVHLQEPSDTRPARLFSCPEHDEYNSNFPGKDWNANGQADMSLVLFEEDCVEQVATSFSESPLKNMSCVPEPNNVDFAHTNSSFIDGHGKGNFQQLDFSTERAPIQEYRPHISDIGLFEVAEQLSTSYKKSAICEFDNTSFLAFQTEMQETMNEENWLCERSNQNISPRDILTFPASSLEPHHNRQEKMCSSSSQHWHQSGCNNGHHSLQDDQIHEWSRVADLGGTANAHHSFYDSSEINDFNI